MYNQIANKGKKILEEYEKNKKYKILSTDTDSITILNIDTGNITIRRFKSMYIDKESLMVSLYLGDVEKKLGRVDQISTILYLLSYLFFFIFNILYLNIVILILIMILNIDLIILYRSICYRIAVDKYTQLYNNGYYLTGYIQDNDIISKIDEFFYNHKDMEDYMVKKFGR